MVFVHVKLGRHFTLVHGDAECELDENGRGIEPFICKTKEGETCRIYETPDTIIECYVSKKMYVVRTNDGKITDVVHLGTGPYEEEREWIEQKKLVRDTDTYWVERDRYHIENDKVVRLELHEHVGEMNVFYKEGVISTMTLTMRRLFEGFAIGDRAPDLEDVLHSSYHKNV
jgi:hypothetical protein